ncbi:MAG: hypothetical protein FJ090_22895 [Deltaproteobacteria bacterium]|nr:hypothetical protein [Deltaproteobacteria bacterium]
MDWLRAVGLPVTPENYLRYGWGVERLEDLEPEQQETVPLELFLPAGGE